MPKFDAGALAEALEFDFRGAGVEAHGTIPEPTDKLIGAYLDEVKAAFTKLSGVTELADIDPNDTGAIMRAMEKVDASQFVSVIDEISQAAARLCGGTPNLTQIRKLPLRVRQHFFSYLYTEIVSPEGGPGAGNVVAINPRSAAAG